jgi:hypothetical protein
VAELLTGGLFAGLSLPAGNHRERYLNRNLRRYSGLLSYLNSARRTPAFGQPKGNSS